VIEGGEMGKDIIINKDGKQESARRRAQIL
jgi:hypothetical protein